MKKKIHIVFDVDKTGKFSQVSLVGCRDPKQKILFDFLEKIHGLSSRVVRLRKRQKSHKQTATEKPKACKCGGRGQEKQSARIQGEP